MVALIEIYWPVVAIALLAGLVSGWLIFRNDPKARRED